MHSARRRPCLASEIPHLQHHFSAGREAPSGAAALLWQMVSPTAEVFRDQMKICDLIFQTPSPRGLGNDGICRVRVFVTPDKRVVALLTDLDNKNTGPSVTNSVERIRQALVDRGIVDNDAQIIEHYEECFGVPTFDFVSLRDGRPIWENTSAEEVAKLTGCTLAELQERTLDHPRLYDEIERIRNLIDPFVDSPDPEDPSVVNRRADIREKMISKKELADLVSTGADERSLQALLKRDLSIFAEVYARPPEEYICFSEFPIQAGFFDFVVFSGRSRMEVILIEIKGANFPFAKQGSYRKFSAKIDEAVHQIRDRVGSIYRKFSDFHSTTQQIREAVEAGGRLHNSLVGPQAPLEVDPQKDVIIRCVVIGGRSRDDLKESQLRQDYEMQSSPSVKVESWDSWLRKLQRE